MRIPLTKPNPAKLSESVSHLRAMEERAVFSNFGPLNTSFEREMNKQFFGGVGECLTVCNATIGLMLAIRHAIESRPKSRRRYALMPSFTFAAAAQAAQWNRLTPLYCDINPIDWSADRSSERQLLERYGDQIAVVVPYATFGFDIDLGWYEEIQRVYSIPVVIDAAASLGTISADGSGFGSGFSNAVIFSMHVTKSFSTSEGGLIYSADGELIRTLRNMSNFGFGEARNATTVGLNGKMSEISALMAHLRLETFEAVMERRSELMALYRAGLSELSFQPMRPRRQANQFTSVLLPQSMASFRPMVQYEMAIRGVATATYFSPHVAEQAYFRGKSEAPVLPVTDDVASRVIALPLFDTMTDEQVGEVVSALKASLAVVEQMQRPSVSVAVASASQPETAHAVVLLAAQNSADKDNGQLRL